MSESRARTSREVWEKRVGRWKDSGLSGPEFAREVGLNPRTLAYWKWRLSREAQGATPRSSERSRTQPPTGAQPQGSFVEVAASVPTDDRFELELSGGRRLRIPRDFDEATLRRVVRALEVS